MLKGGGREAIPELADLLQRHRELADLLQRTTDAGRVSQASQDGFDII